jgi:uncharacterized protein (UPF0147 family)
MRKEVKQAKENVDMAILILKRLSEKDTIPEKVRKKSSDVVSTLEKEIDNIQSILNTYIA